MFFRKFDPFNPLDDSLEGFEHFTPVLLARLVVVGDDVDAFAPEMLRECRKPLTRASWVAGCRLAKSPQRLNIPLSLDDPDGSRVCQKLGKPVRKTLDTLHAPESGAVND